MSPGVLKAVSATGRFEHAEAEVKRTLELRSKNASAEVDGFCPLFAYRRLLNLAHHLRMVKYEEEPEFSGTCVRSILGQVTQTGWVRCHNRSTILTLTFSDQVS